MGVFKGARQDFYICREGYPHIDRGRFDEFTANVLGLGDLTAASEDIDTVAAVFDLAGFTSFCTQIDPQLAISEYLASFLEWLFDAVKKYSLAEERYGAKDRHRRDQQNETFDEANEDNTVATFATLPFFAKFMGDGVLFLWATKGLTEKTVCSIPAILLQVCASYSSDFLKTASMRVADPPAALRCGVARGKVFSVGNGEDFVGPCINMAARLQKLSDLRLAFSRRGFDADKFMDAHVRTHFVLKKVSVRGIGNGELVFVDKRRFDRLDDSEKAKFSDPDERWRKVEEQRRLRELAAFEPEAPATPNDAAQSAQDSAAAVVNDERP